jgi:hypothetical protein
MLPCLLPQHSLLYAHAALLVATALTAICTCCLACCHSTHYPLDTECMAVRRFHHHLLLARCISMRRLPVGSLPMGRLPVHLLTLVYIESSFLILPDSFRQCYTMLSVCYSFRPFNLKSLAQQQVSLQRLPRLHNARHCCFPLQKYHILNTHM